MSLPSPYITSSDYFSDALSFLKSYQWIYNFPNTDILVQNIFDEVPKEWLPFLKALNNDSLNELAAGILENDSVPNSLSQYLTRAESLKPRISRHVQESSFRFRNNSGLSKKKTHEIVSLAPVIDKTCQNTKSEYVVDIGAGLGYLSQLLFNEYKYPILAIEGCEEKVASASKIQNKNNSHGVIYLQHFITCESAEKINTAIRDHLNTSENVCLCGLHACADLSIIILQLFSTMECAKSLVIMPCCYHRYEIESSDERTETFKYFPASNILKEMFKEYLASSFVRRPLLRLACQQTLFNFTKMTKQEHLEHARNCLYRAILQLAGEEVPESCFAVPRQMYNHHFRKCLENIDVALRMSFTMPRIDKIDLAIQRIDGEKIGNLTPVHCKVSRLKRKIGKSRYCRSDDFNSYIDNIKNTHELVCTKSFQKLDTDDVHFKERLVKIWLSNRENCYLVEVLMAFQTGLQSICENILLLDRIEFLKERGIVCYTEKVTDDRISPRCYALVAVKT